MYERHARPDLFMVLYFVNTSLNKKYSIELLIKTIKVDTAEFPCYNFKFS